MSESNYTKKILYSTLLFVFTVGLMLAIYAQTSLGESERRTRWSKIDTTDNTVITRDIYQTDIRSKDRFYFERYTTSPNSPGAVIEYTCIIQNILTRNALKLDTVGIPPNFLVYPEDGTSVSFHEHTPNTAYEQRLYKWSLSIVQSGRYTLSPAMFPQVSLNSSNPSQINFDPWLNYIDAQQSTNLFEFVQSADNVFYIRKSGTQKYMAEIEVAGQRQVAWLPIYRADRFIVWPDTQTNYPMPKIDIQNAKRLYAQTVSEFIRGESTLKGVLINDNKGLVYDDKDALGISIKVNVRGLYRNNGWQCHTYAIESGAGVLINSPKYYKKNCTDLNHQLEEKYSNAPLFAQGNFAATSNEVSRLVSDYVISRPIPYDYTQSSSTGGDDMASNYYIQRTPYTSYSECPSCVVSDVNLYCGFGNCECIQSTSCIDQPLKPLTKIGDLSRSSSYNYAVYQAHSSLSAIQLRPSIVLSGNASVEYKPFTVSGDMCDNVSYYANKPYVGYAFSLGKSRIITFDSAHLIYTYFANLNTTACLKCNINVAQIKDDSLLTDDYLLFKFI